MCRIKEIGEQLKIQRFRAPLVVIAAIAIIMAGPAMSAQAAPTNVGTGFNASNYNTSTQKKEGTLTATGTLCKKAYTKQGFKVQGVMKVTKIAGVFKSTQRFNARVWVNDGTTVTGPNKAVSVGATSTTALTPGYVSGSDSVQLSIGGSGLLAGETSSLVKVSSLGNC